MVTDPIVFSEDKALGLVDFGTLGMKRFLEKHVCNDVCKVLPMVYDEQVSKKLEVAQAAFKIKTFDAYAEDLALIFGKIAKK